MSEVATPEIGMRVSIAGRMARGTVEELCVRAPDPEVAFLGDWTRPVRVLLDVGCRFWFAHAARLASDRDDFYEQVRGEPARWRNVLDDHVVAIQTLAPIVHTSVEREKRRLISAATGKRLTDVPDGTPHTVIHVTAGSERFYAMLRAHPEGRRLALDVIALALRAADFEAPIALKQKRAQPFARHEWQRRPKVMTARDLADSAALALVLDCLCSDGSSRDAARDVLTALGDIVTASPPSTETFAPQDPISVLRRLAEMNDCRMQPVIEPGDSFLPYEARLALGPDRCAFTIGSGTSSSVGPTPWRTK